MANSVISHPQEAQHNHGIEDVVEREADVEPDQLLDDDDGGRGEEEQPESADDFLQPAEGDARLI